MIAIHHAAHGSGYGPLLLIALIAAAAWLVSRYLWPFGPCPKCKGSGVNKGSNKKRFGECPRCRGRRRVQRFGSKTVHRIAWTIRGEAARRRQEHKDKQAADQAEHPRRLL